MIQDKKNYLLLTINQTEPCFFCFFLSEITSNSTETFITCLKWRTWHCFSQYMLYLPFKLCDFGNILWFIVILANSHESGCLANRIVFVNHDGINSLMLLFFTTTTVELNMDLWWWKYDESWVWVFVNDTTLNKNVSLSQL